MTGRCLLMLAAAVAARGQCLPVQGERILAGDLARAVPAFAGLAPELVLGYAPAPGARRVYGAAELSRLARRYGLAAEPGMEVCFARPLETLTSERVAAALREALPAARIEILEFSKQPVPPGELSFPVSGLRTDPAGHAPLFWHGIVAAAGHDDFPVWAKVRVQVSGKRVTAIAALAQGRPIESSQLREEPYEGPPGWPDLSQIVGGVPRRPIPAGTPIELRWLDPPADVVRGELVRLEIRSGRTRVLLDGRAVSSAKRGDFVGVRNPANGKILEAIVADRGRAILDTDRNAVVLPQGANR